MKTTQNNGLHECCRCHRELPTENFYFVNMEKGQTDRYCKDCRRVASTLQYIKRSGQEAAPRRYPLITEEHDPARRKALIMNAVKVVRESVRRKAEYIRENASDE